MKGIILAAGIASRLRPITDNIPKCLLKIGEQRILERTLNNLLKNGIDDIVIVTGYLESQIKDFVGLNFPELNVEYITNEIYNSTNNIYSLWLAKDSILGNDILLLDSDIIFDSRIINKLITSGHKNCLAVRSDHVLGEEEIKVTVDEENYITEISKVVNPKEAVGESIGIELFDKEFNRKLFEILEDKMLRRKEVNHFYEAAFEEAIQKGSKIFSVDVEGLRCIEIDTADDIQSAEEEVVKYVK